MRALYLKSQRIPEPAWVDPFIAASWRLGQVEHTPWPPQPTVYEWIPFIWGFGQCLGYDLRDTSHQKNGGNLVNVLKRIQVWIEWLTVRHFLPQGTTNLHRQSNQVKMAIGGSEEGTIFVYPICSYWFVYHNVFWYSWYGLRVHQLTPSTSSWLCQTLPTDSCARTIGNQHWQLCACRFGEAPNQQIQESVCLFHGRSWASMALFVFGNNLNDCKKTRREAYWAPCFKLTKCQIIMFHQHRFLSNKVFPFSARDPRDVSIIWSDDIHSYDTRFFPKD